MKTINFFKSLGFISLFTLPLLSYPYTTNGLQYKNFSTHATISLQASIDSANAAITRGTVPTRPGTILFNINTQNPLNYYFEIGQSFATQQHTSRQTTINIDSTYHHFTINNQSIILATTTSTSSYINFTTTDTIIKGNYLKDFPTTTYTLYNYQPGTVIIKLSKSLTTPTLPAITTTDTIYNYSSHHIYNNNSTIISNNLNPTLIHDTIYQTLHDTIYQTITNTDTIYIDPETQTSIQFLTNNSIFYSNNNLNINSTYNIAKIYNINGQLLSTYYNEPQIPLNRNNIYIINIDSNFYKISTF